MFVIGSNSASTGYNLTRSLRFRSSATAYLNRTPSVQGSLTTWTYSLWVKRGALSIDSNLLMTRNSGGNYTGIYFGSANTLSVDWWVSGTNKATLTTTQVFRDPSAWYHIVVAIDSTNATSSNRIKMYVNGVQITAFGTATYPPQNEQTIVNQTIATWISSDPAYPAQGYFDGYLAEVNFIDGQALTPSSFGSTNALTGVWQPARYTGTYGTNGFYLPFTDNSALTTSSNVGLGKDFSGNANYWVTNNISITAGTTYDSMTDVPTLTSATASNFCVFNPLDKGSALTVSNGNLSITGSASNNSMGKGSFWVTSGKWYWESTATAGSLGAVVGIGGLTFAQIPWSGDMYGYDANGNKIVNGTSSAYGATYAVNDVIGVALDLTAGTITFYKNNVSQGAITGVSTSLLWTPFNHANNGVTVHWNMGQRPFTYTPPTGFVALNTFNLPTSTIVKGNTVMDATLYTGTGASLSVTNTASFKPDLVWVKGRSGATDHAWYDSVRGTTKQIESNNTGAETTEATGLTAFGSAGFTVGALAQMNTSAATYVGWQWQAGQGSTSSNTNGTITSTVSVNASAGFSVVTYTGTGVAATVGHGLGVTPQFIIVKNRSSGSSNWAVYTTTTGVNNVLFLNGTDASTAATGKWSGTNSSVFGINTATDVNGSGNSIVAYCWTPIAGFSAFGSYTGNGSTDGVFVYFGFKPRFVMIKRTDGADSWCIWDTARNTYNAVDELLLPNSSSAAITPYPIDVLSNGMKARGTNTAYNASGGTYIYAAFASNPFRNSLAQ